jgi:hypothetical protein
MSKSLDQAAIEARIVRYLLVEGRQCDISEIRLGGGLGHLPSRVIWDALAYLVKSRLVATTQATDTQDHAGFVNEITYPVFWVDRASILSECIQPPGEWWPGYLRRAVRKGVQP